MGFVPPKILGRVKKTPDRRMSFEPFKLFRMKKTLREEFVDEINKDIETEAERWSRAEGEQEAASLYASTMYSQIYETTDGVLYYQAEDGKQFRLVDEESNEAKVIKEAAKIEKAQIKDRALLI